MRVAWIFLAFALSACSSDDNTEPQFQVVDCDQDWQAPAGAQCQRPCEHAVLAASGAACLDARLVQADGTEGVYACSSTFEWEGLQGCCLRDHTQIYFVQCN